MAKMQEIICACGCGRKKMVRTADIKRGWGKFYSKSCKAIAQERRTGQYQDFLAGARYNEGHGMLGEDDPSWDAHKDSF